MRFKLLTLDEQIAVCRNILYAWNTGWCLLWLLVLEVLAIVEAVGEVDVPVWLYSSLAIIVVLKFLGQRAWAANNSMGCLNLLFWPFSMLLLAVEAPIMGILWLLKVVVSPKFEFGKWAFAADKIAEFKRRGLTP